jgi:hypothetical protein
MADTFELPALECDVVTRSLNRRLCRNKLGCPWADAIDPVAERATAAIVTTVAMFKEIICLIMSYSFRVGFPRYEQFARTNVSWRLDEWLSNTIFRSI